MSNIHTQQIAIGTRVSCSLPYCGRGIVYDVQGEQRPDTVRSFSGVGVAGGNARIAVVFANGSLTNVPECLVRGSVQWNVLDDESLATADEISAAIAHAEAVAADKAAAAQREAQAFAADVERLKSDPALSHLTQGDDPYSGTLAAKNMRALLRRAFPGVKFSVRKHHYGSVAVQWEDGPLEREVEAIVNRFKGGHFDGMDDSYKRNRSAWVAVFGGADYINARRELSDALLCRVIDELFESRPGTFSELNKPTVADYQSGSLYRIDVPGLGQTLQQVIREAAHCAHAE